MQGIDKPEPLRGRVLVVFTDVEKPAGGRKRRPSPVSDREAALLLELNQLREALPFKPDAVLLDNMSTAMLKEAVAIVGDQAKTEASGGVRLDTVKAIAQTGVDYISSGALTHSAINLDVGLDFEA